MMLHEFEDDMVTPGRFFQHIRELVLLLNEHIRFSQVKVNIEDRLALYDQGMKIFLGLQ